MDFKKVKAYGFLGRHFLTHFFRKWTRPVTSGQTLFLKSYRADGIFPIDAFTRRDMPSYSQCLTCRLCDLACPDLARHPERISPSYLVTCFSRSLPDFRYYRDDLLACHDCRACEEVCPERVPIGRIADWLRRTSSVLNDGTSASTVPLKCS